MKSIQSIAKISVLIILLVAFAAILQYEKSSHSVISNLLLLPLFSLLFYLYVSGYFKPTIWLFKNKFLISGSIIGIYTTSARSFKQLSLVDYSNPRIVFQEWIVPIVFGIVAMGVYVYFTKKRLTKITHFNLECDEEEIISDSAYFEDDDSYLTKGRLVLTNNRLCFIPANKDKTSIEFRNISSKLFTDKTWGIPGNIFIPINGTKIRTSFPLFWKDEIEKVLLK